VDTVVLCGVVVSLVIDDSVVDAAVVVVVSEAFK
jgi:hypothetical protein